MSNHAIQLNSGKPAQRVIKRGALLAFTALRGLFAQAGQDIKDAWRESARPNV